MVDVEKRKARRDRRRLATGVAVQRLAGASQAGDWESYLEEFRKDDGLSVWASFKVRECHARHSAKKKVRIS